MKDFGEILRKKRIDLNLTQGFIEKETGVKREYISKIENGDLKNVTLKTGKKLANALTTPLWQLIKEMEE